MHRIYTTGHGTLNKYTLNNETKLCKNFIKKIGNKWNSRCLIPFSQITVTKTNIMVYSKVHFLKSWVKMIYNFME